MTDIRPSSRCACGKWWSNLELFQDHVCDIGIYSRCGRCSHQIGNHRFAGGATPPTHRVCAIAGCKCREFVDAYGDPVEGADHSAECARALEELAAQDPGITDKVGFINTRPKDVDQDYTSQILRTMRRRQALVSEAVGLARELRAEGRYVRADVLMRCAGEIRESLVPTAPDVDADRLKSVAEWLIAEERHKGELAAAYWRDDVLPAVRRDIEHHKAAAGRCRRMLTRYLTVGIQRRMRMDAALTTIQQVRDAVKGMRSTLGKGDPPHIAYGFFLDRLDRITSQGGGGNA